MPRQFLNNSKLASSQSRIHSLKGVGKGETGKAGNLCATTTSSHSMTSLNPQNSDQNSAHCSL